MTFQYNVKQTNPKGQFILLRHVKVRHTIRVPYAVPYIVPQRAPPKKCNYTSRWRRTWSAWYRRISGLFFPKCSSAPPVIFKFRSSAENMDMDVLSFLLFNLSNFTLSQHRSAQFHSPFCFLLPENTSTQWKPQCLLAFRWCNGRTMQRYKCSRRRRLHA